MNEENLHFDLITLIEDARFIAWVNNPDGVEAKFFKSWIKNNPDKKDLIEEAQAMVQSLKIVEPQQDPEIKTRIWNKIDHETSNESSTELKPKRFNLSWWMPAVAACILFGVVFTFLRGSSDPYYSGFAEQKTIVLPDNSKVYLNADSRISFDKAAYNSPNREINLTGEAYFEVEKGGRFVVSTRSGFIEVVGTSFNVKDRDHGLIVQCTTGKVQVNNSARSLRTRLLPGGQIYVSGIDYKRSEFDVEQGIGWRNGIFEFKDEPLSRVVNSIERQFDVEVEIEEGLQALNYTGSFKLGDLSKALYAVCWPMKLAYTIDGDKVVIKKE